MIRRPPRSTRTDTLFPYTTLFRSATSRTIPHRIGQGASGFHQPLTQRGCPFLYIGPTIVGNERSAQMAYRPRRSRQLLHRACGLPLRSEEHTSELQSLMRISYAVFCLKKKKKHKTSQPKTLIREQ